MSKIKDIFLPRSSKQINQEAGIFAQKLTANIKGWGESILRPQMQAIAPLVKIGQQAMATTTALLETYAANPQEGGQQLAQWAKEKALSKTPRLANLLEQGQNIKDQGDIGQQLAQWAKEKALSKAPRLANLLEQGKNIKEQGIAGTMSSLLQGFIGGNNALTSLASLINELSGAKLADLLIQAQQKFFAQPIVQKVAAGVDKIQNFGNQVYETAQQTIITKLAGLSKDPITEGLTFVTDMLRKTMQEALAELVKSIAGPEGLMARGDDKMSLMNNDLWKVQKELLKVMGDVAQNTRAMKQNLDNLNGGL